jgi:PhnB protein
VVLVKARKESESGKMPIRQKMAEMRKFNEELIKAGIMLVGEGLKPSSTGVCVRSSGTDRIVTGGPFAETKELVAGYWIWEVESMEEAITWLERCPNPMPEDSEVEIRAIWSLEDIASVNSASGCSSVP